MSETCPTVKVKADNDDGFIVINESDFDPKVHKRFEEPTEDHSKAKKAK